MKEVTREYIIIVLFGLVVLLTSASIAIAEDTAKENLKKSQEQAQQSVLDYEQTRQKSLRLEEAITWLNKKKAENPEEAETVFEKCKTEGVDISVTLNCMYRILGD